MRRSVPVVLGLLILSGFFGSASAEEARAFPDWPQKWQLGLGQEFPGAAGTLEQETAEGARNETALRLRGDFTKGGNYVAAYYSCAQPVSLSELTVRIRSTLPAFWLRIAEASGQTFQQRIPLDPTRSGWQEVRIHAFGDPSREKTVHWGGLNDGRWKGPAKTIGIILHSSDLRGGKTGDLLIGGLEWRTHSGESDFEKPVVLVDDFAAEPHGWTLSLGGEFPGAKAAVTRETLADGPVQAGLRLRADFSGGGRYVAVGRNLASPLYLEELRLLVRTRAKSLALRLTDSQKQVFQQYLKPVPQDDWQELVVQEFGNPDNRGIFHWGGKNDGVWRGPATNITLLLNGPVAPESDSVLIGRVSAVVSEHVVKLTPVGAPLAFYLPTDAPSHLSWSAAEAVTAAGLQYAIEDYQGELVERGSAVQDDKRNVSCSVTLPAGYYEMVFPANGYQRFGLFVQRRDVEQPDPFFCIDSAFEYFSPGDSSEGRIAYLKMLRKTGIGMIRERFGWSKRQWEEGRFDFDRWKRKALRQEAADCGVEILEDFCPVWNGALEEPLPDDIFQFVRSLDSIASQLGPGWTASEFWNEPDIACRTPGDVYGAKFRAAVYHMNRRFPGRTIVGGVMNNQVKRANFETYASNGLLENCDVFSYHDYTPPDATETTAERFRSWCADYGRGDIPMWITEAGRYWKTGPERPHFEEGLACAHGLAHKTVEAKACGIERFFAFLLLFFEEGRNNWGMHGRRHTPTRLMASYAAAADRLAHARYLGDLAVEGPLLRARAFARENEVAATVVLIAARSERHAAVRLPIPFSAAHGVDGRTLLAREDGRVPIPDGIVYVTAARADLDPLLVRATPAMQLTEMARSRTTQRQPAVPVTIIPQPDPEQICFSGNGYNVQNPTQCVLGGLVCNLSEQDQTLTFVAATPEGTVCEAERMTVTVPAGGSVKAAWPLRFERPMIAGSPPRDILIHAEEMPGCFWRPRILGTETATALRLDPQSASLSPTTSTEGWKALGEAEYVPWGVIPYDGRTRVWARVGWSEGEIGVDVIVEKPVHSQPHEGAEIWRGDSIQIALQAPGARATPTRFTEIAAALTPRGPQLYRHAAQSKDPKKVGPMDAHRLRIEQKDGRMLYSLRFPVEEVDLPTLEAGMTIRFSLIANYHDGATRAGYFHWGDGIAHQKAPAEYCLLKLEERP